jgi:hypothetical protein
MTKAELAWLAGLFEGEGTIYAHKVGARHYAHLSITSTDYDVLEKVAALTGAKIYERPNDPSRIGKRTIYNAAISKSGVALALAALMLPWLGERRRDQIAKTVALVNANGPDLRGGPEVWQTRRARYGQRGGNQLRRQAPNGKFLPSEAPHETATRVGREH